jgi:hypothetical protein
MNIIECMDEPKLWQRWFKDQGTWSAWRVFYKSLFALEMTDEELKVYRTCTDRKTPPAFPAREGLPLLRPSRW